MSEIPSAITYQVGQENQSKFDYFIAGVTGAIFAYVSQSYIPHRLGLDFYALEAAAIVFLAISFFMGLKRIESTAAVVSFNHSMLKAAEKASLITKKLSAPGSGIFTHSSGIELTAQEMTQKRSEHLAESAVAKQAMDIFVARGARYYTLRDIFLIAGFSSIVLAKIFAPYVTP